jgi:O-antigen ligase
VTIAQVTRRDSAPTPGAFSDAAMPLVAATAAAALGVAAATAPSAVLPAAVLLGVPLVFLVLRAVTDLAVGALLLLVLLAATVIFGRNFSALHAGPIYITEVALAAAAVGAVSVTVSARRSSIVMPGASGPLFAVYFVLGGVATWRGLAAGADPYYVARDAVLVAYSVLAVLVVAAFPRMADVATAYRYLTWAAIPATAVAALSLVTPGAIDGIPVAQGVYLSFFFLPALARWTAGSRVGQWEWALMGCQAVLLVLLTARTGWIASLLAVSFLLVTGDRGPWRRAAVVIAVLVATAVVAFTWILPSLGGDATISRTASSVGAELRGTISPSSAGDPSANSAWRLSFWGFELDRTLSEPLLGTGFGPPANFCFARLLPPCTDQRITRDSSDTGQYTPPHNSFIHIAFRMGIPGILVLALLMTNGLRGALGRLTLARLRGSDDRALLIRSTIALFLFVACTSFFSAGLEVPYIGIFFWTSLGFLLVCARE